MFVDFPEGDGATLLDHLGFKPQPGTDTQLVRGSRCLFSPAQAKGTKEPHNSDRNQDQSQNEQVLRLYDALPVIQPPSTNSYFPTSAYPVWKMSSDTR